MNESSNGVVIPANAGIYQEQTVDSSLQQRGSRGNDNGGGIRFVLVNPSHPGNIGASARAMKTMGLENLYLVSPLKFPHIEATHRAVGAEDVLNKAIVTHSLIEAIAPCQLVFGMSARLRELPKEMLTPRQAADLVCRESPDTPIAFLFGNEQSGLSNDELKYCHYHVRIPTSPTFSSLNLAAAVQVMAYELWVQSLEDQGTSSLYTRLNFAEVEEMEGLYHHLEEMVVQIGYLHTDNPRHVMDRFRQILGRARIGKDELDLLRGIIHAVQRNLAEKG